MLNWKYLRTSAGKVTYALCVGDRMTRELDDAGMVCACERSMPEEFENSVDDFLHDCKLAFEAKKRGEYYDRKVPYTASGPFGALQRKLAKDAEKKR